VLSNVDDFKNDQTDQAAKAQQYLAEVGRRDAKEAQAVTEQHADGARSLVKDMKQRFEFQELSLFQRVRERLSRFGADVTEKHSSYSTSIGDSADEICAELDEAVIEEGEVVNRRVDDGVQELLNQNSLNEELTKSKKSHVGDASQQITG
jgi:hypothetical protein